MNSVTFENLPELPFAAAESINQLRVNLSLCGKDIKSIMITSCEPNEGKSFVSLSLVRSIAASGARVLLIDCDLRNSTAENTTCALVVPGFPALQTCWLAVPVSRMSFTAPTFPTLTFSR